LIAILNAMSGGGHGGGGLPFLDVIENLLHTSHGKGGIHTAAKPLIILFAVVLVVFFIFAPGQSIRNFSFLIFFAPLWVPLLLGRWVLYQFVTAQRVAYIARQKHILLEIRLPRDTMKTPAAMESVFSALHLGPGEATWWKKFVLGQSRPWYSFEIVSLGGRVHFYIWTREAYRRAIESALYAQYPGIEVIEAEDYSRLVDPSHEPQEVVGFEYVKSKAQGLPIRTFVDFGLDRTAKPEEQNDPLAQIVELLGSLGPHEQLWCQIIIRTHKGERYRKKDYTWKDEAREEIDNLRKEALQEAEFVDPASGKVMKTKMVNMSKGLGDKIGAIERNVGKLAFDAGIRVLYTAPKDYYQGIVGGYIVGFFKPFNSEGGNSLGVTEDWSNKYSDYPWEDPHGHHKAHSMHLMVEMYRRRAFFYSPYVGLHSVMSTEELATLYHVPSATIATPNLPRIQSTTSGAPANLPS